MREEFFTVDYLDSTLPLMIDGAVTYYANWLGINKKYSGALGAGAAAITVPVQKIILKDSLLFPVLATVIIAPALIDAGKKAVNFVSKFFSNDEPKQITPPEQPSVNEEDNSIINDKKVETIEEEDVLIEESNKAQQSFIETTKTTYEQRVEMIEQENFLLFSEISFKNCHTIANRIIDKYFQKNSEKLKEDFARFFKLELPEIPERITLDLQFKKHPHEVEYIDYLLQEKLNYFTNTNALKGMDLHITEENKNENVLKAMKRIYNGEQQKSGEEINNIVAKFTKEEVWLLIQNMIVNYVNNGIEIREMNSDTKGHLEEIQQFIFDAITQKLRSIDDGNAVVGMIGKIMVTFPEILLFKGSGKISEISSIKKEIGFSIQKTNNIFELVKLLNCYSVIYYIEMNIDYGDYEEESDYSDIDSSDEDEGEGGL